MKRVYIYCEGQTEEAFINEILYPYFMNMGIYVYPIICSTKRTVDKKYKGGVVDYNKIKKELILICRQHTNEFVTTMFDYYALPSNTPNINCSDSNLYKRIEIIEQSIENDIRMENLFFGLTLHEFEGLLFSDPNAFLEISNTSIVEKIQNIRDSALTPEHVNNSPQTAPSKRILSLIPNYSKVLNGIAIAKKIGINKMLEECKHFNDWITKIKNLNT